MRAIIVIALSAMLLPAASKPEPTEAEIQKIITAFAAKESAFLRARELYTYRQDVRVEDCDASGGACGKFEVLSDIVFTGEGKRTERVVRAPVPALRYISFSPEDEQDIRSVQPFVLNTQELPKYHVRYLGRETLDEVECYAFAVKPKDMAIGERYFAGIAWVDVDDLQIVRTYGRALGKLKKNSDQRFPKFETYREQIDGKYWFPTLTRADDMLYFDEGTYRLKMRIRYAEYKRFKADTTITFGDEVKDSVDKGNAPSGPVLAPPLPPRKKQ
ncbi:MAG: outer membrane lipoprotein-sorting protein [Acidobacteria bacterium]|nr:outer membrane lipoprotein-sorting protein [Acidobacteriota bacterium]